MKDWNVALVMILVMHDKGLIHKPSTCSGGHSVRGVSLYLVVKGTCYQVLGDIQGVYH